MNARIEYFVNERFSCKMDTVGDTDSYVLQIGEDSISKLLYTDLNIYMAEEDVEDILTKIVTSCNAMLRKLEKRRQEND